MTCILPPLMRIPDLQVLQVHLRGRGGAVHWYHRGFGWEDGGVDGRSFQWEATETLCHQNIQNYSKIFFLIFLYFYSHLFERSIIFLPYV